MVRRLRAFTLVELLVVIGIIALLVSILLPALTKVRRQGYLIACSAQLRDFGNAIQMYAQGNKGWLPGPCLGQIRAAYYQQAFGVADNNAYSSLAVPGGTLASFLWPYLKLPAPPQNATATADGTAVVLKSLLCPAYVAQNQGLDVTENSWTYQVWDFDPYPWWGYPNHPVTYFPLRSAQLHITTDTNHYMPQMKLSQIKHASEVGIIGDADKALFLYDENYINAAAGMPSTPVHGGKPETKAGLGMAPPLSGNWDGVSLKYKIIDKTAATNPPRNYLYADGHVTTLYFSGPPAFPAQK